MNESDLDGLTLLGKEAQPSKKLEIFPNHHPERDYTVTLRTGEFTCVCPVTGQPDFASLTITYTPDKSIVESKSLKLYLSSFRNEGVFHEHVTNTILDDLVKILEPRWCKVSGAFAVRGGIAITVDAEYRKKPPIVHTPPTEQTIPKPRTDWNERPPAREGKYKSPPHHWEGERSRSRPERESSQDRFAGPRRRPAPGEYRTERGEHRPAPAEYRPEREKRWPDRDDRRPAAEPKRSERRTTKTLGETRTWRKRI